MCHEKCDRGFYEDLKLKLKDYPKEREMDDISLSDFLGLTDACEYN